MENIAIKSMNIKTVLKIREYRNESNHVKHKLN